MPKLVQDTDTMDTSHVGSGVHAFQFSGTRLQHLAGLATAYVLVTIAVDETGSTSGFEHELRNMLIMCVNSCKKCPTATNLLLRVIKFSDALPGGIEEIHGFKPLGEIDPKTYPAFKPGGSTPLYDTLYTVVAATNAYGSQLAAGDYDAAGITFVITDGLDNTSKSTRAMVKNEITKAVSGETLVSFVSVVVGINAASCKAELDKLAIETGAQFRDAGDATEQNLAKLAAFVSQSVSSTSQAVATGAPSQPISATI